MEISSRLDVSDVTVFKFGLLISAAVFFRLVAVLHVIPIDNLPVKIVENTDWAKGMGISIKMGINQVLNSFPKVVNCIISVCDQLFD